MRNQKTDMTNFRMSTKDTAEATAELCTHAFSVTPRYEHRNQGLPPDDTGHDLHKIPVSYHYSGRIEMQLFRNRREK